MSAGTVFGDYDPEDAWDINDAVAEQLRNIARRVQWIAERVGGDLPTLEEVRAHANRLGSDLAYITARVLARDLDQHE